MNKKFVALFFSTAFVSFSAITLLVTITACQSSQTKTAVTAPASDETEANLTQKEAANRKGLVDDIHYDLEIHVDANHETFSAVSIVMFKLAKKESVFLDFKNGAKISAFSVNDQTKTPAFTNHRLTLAAADLHEGVNKVEVTYDQVYSHDGRGLHRFTDPEDKNVYLYTQFESYDAHQMFPCFDQPDLKGTLTLKVTAPSAWQVITTTRESKIAKSAGESVWTFPSTPKISTYLFSLHAGPYAKWEEKAGAVPMRLFVRQALKSYVKPQEWFVPTRAGLKFYGDYFHYPYPFKKFDEIIAPDFNAGAMENVAAITFTEHFVHRGPSTREERESTASVILHEMAHMWFGDLVTMKWWNGLWLNESFATFMSALSENRATDFKESWPTFFRHEKQWAYFEDQLVTTHPIEATVDDVATAFTNFDGITYGKGASVLKQLNFYLGDKSFREGVRLYFKTYAYSNTSLSDFIGALGTASKADLKPWAKSWLEDAGLDSVQPSFTCEKGKIAKFELQATGPDARKTPRVHKTLVRLYTGSALDLGNSVTVAYADGSTTISQLKGTDCPTFVDVNDEDHDYVKAKFDAQSLTTLQTSAMKIKDAFTRLRIWPSLQQMVRDGEIPPTTYLKIAAQYLPLETDLQSVEQLVLPLAQDIYYLPIKTDTEKKARASWVEKFEALVWDRMQKAPGGSDLQKSMLMKYVEISESQNARDHLANLLTNKEPVKGLTIDQDRRWSLLIALSQLGDSRVAQLLDAEKKADGSELGIQLAQAVEAAQPTLAAKRVWFDTLLTNPDVKYARARTATRTMFSPLQKPMLETFANEYYEKLPDFANHRQIDIVELFTIHFAPLLCDESSSTRLKDFIDKNPTLPPTVLKQLRMDHQENARCAKIRSSART